MGGTLEYAGCGREDKVESYADVGPKGLGASFVTDCWVSHVIRSTIARLFTGRRAATITIV